MPFGCGLLADARDLHLASAVLGLAREAWDAGARRPAAARAGVGNASRRRGPSRVGRSWAELCAVAEERRI